MTNAVNDCYQNAIGSRRETDRICMRAFRYNNNAWPGDMLLFLDLYSHSHRSPPNQFNNGFHWRARDNTNITCCE